MRTFGLLIISKTIWLTFKNLETSHKICITDLKSQKLCKLRSSIAAWKPWSGGKIGLVTPSSASMFQSPCTPLAEMYNQPAPLLPYLFGPLLTLRWPPWLSKQFDAFKIRQDGAQRREATCLRPSNDKIWILIFPQWSLHSCIMNMSKKLFWISTPCQKCPANTMIAAASISKWTSSCFFLRLNIIMKRNYDNHSP